MLVAHSAAYLCVCRAADLCNWEPAEAKGAGTTAAVWRRPVCCSRRVPGVALSIFQGSHGLQRTRRANFMLLAAKTVLTLPEQGATDLLVPVDEIALAFWEETEWGQAMREQLDDKPFAK
jgi:hypothetical protein